MMSSPARERRMNDASLFASAPTCAPLFTAVVLLGLHGLHCNYCTDREGGSEDVARASGTMERACHLFAMPSCNIWMQQQEGTTIVAHAWIRDNDGRACMSC
jgi:hypothetical protein